MRRRVDYRQALLEGRESRAKEAAETPGEEAAETPQEEAAEVKAGLDNTVAGPRAVGPATEPFKAAGTGGEGKGGAGGGLNNDHPLNRVTPISAGTGADGKGGKGGGEQRRGGHPQNTVLPGKSKHNADPGGQQPKKFIAAAIKRPGALTADVDGKPSEHMGKVRKLASSGTPLQRKQAGFFLNVLNKV